MAVSAASTAASFAQGDGGVSAIAARKAEMAKRQTEYQAALTKQQSEYQAKINEFKAKSALQQANISKQRIMQDNELKQKEAALQAEFARQKGFQKLHSLGSHTGVRLDTGSPLAASANILAQQKLDEGLADYKSALADWQAGLDAGLTEWQGLAEANMGNHNAQITRTKGNNKLNEIYYGGPAGHKQLCIRGGKGTDSGDILRLEQRTGPDTVRRRIQPCTDGYSLKNYGQSQSYEGGEKTSFTGRSKIVRR